ncbi:unnamed protein product [Durusdinium trenchii]
MQQIEELDSKLRFSAAEVTRLQQDLENVKKQESELRHGKIKYEAEMGKASQEKLKMQEELARLRAQLQREEAIPSPAVLAEELDRAWQDLEAKETLIRDLQVAGTRTGAQLVEAMEKQRHNEQMVSRVPQLEGEIQSLRQDLSTKLSELAVLKETLAETEEKLRLREEAAPELRAAELLATEAERLEEELTDVHAQYATMQVELKKREDLLRGIPLVLADFLEQIHLPDPALSSSHVRPEEAPKLLIASLRRLQMAVMKRDEELKVASEKITELSKYATMYVLEVTIVSGFGLRDAKWKPSSKGVGLSCAVDVHGKKERFETKGIHTAKNPVWNHKAELQMSYSDTLCFAVQGEQKLGQALLPASRVVAAGSDGYDGNLALEERATEVAADAVIKVKVVVKKSFPIDEAQPAAQPAAQPSRTRPAPAKPVKSKEAAPPSSYYSDSRTDVYSSESEGTPRDRPNLLQAAKAGDLQQVSSILKGKVEVSSLTAALHGACSEGHRKLLPVLCRAKANVNGLDSSGLTPLHVAAFRGDNPVVQQLCQLGANIKAVDEEGWTPLYVVAAFGGQEDVFKTLLTAKSDVNFTTPDGTTIAMAAEQKGFTQLLKLL